MQKTDNRTIGGQFEQVLANKLFEAGFWCHVMQQNKSGQPADLVAAKGKYHTLIDAKVISENELKTKGFPFSRIEENQRSAMLMFAMRCGEDCWFAIQLPDENIYMHSYTKLMSYESGGAKRLVEQQIRRGWTLEKWIEAANTWAEDA